MNVSLPQLSDADITELTNWRRELHRNPELSGEERQTAARVVEMLVRTKPDEVITGIGGHGVAAIYDSGRAGPRVLLRCELDGLPIEDLAEIPHRSTVPDKGHQCGHDGHMAMIAAMARLLGRQRPQTGAVILMFQPAEEDGSGAQKVVQHPSFSKLAPDYAFAIHNMPGMPRGHVEIIEGPVCCASRGIKIRLVGRTAHASQPEAGISPMGAISCLMPALTAMSSPAVTETRDPDFSLITVTHVDMGAPNFGIAPGEANVFATLRTLTNEAMDGLVQDVEKRVQEVARNNGLEVEIDYTDIFVTCHNDAAAVNIVRDALDTMSVPYGPGSLPMRGSEDFGYFGGDAEMAIMMLGSGENMPSLHNPDFDFPDELIPKGAAIFSAILDALLSDGRLDGLHDPAKQTTSRTLA